MAKDLYDIAKYIKKMYKKLILEEITKGNFLPYSGGEWSQHYLLDTEKGMLRAKVFVRGDSYEESLKEFEN